jgi:hypothetical protein
MKKYYYRPLTLFLFVSILNSCGLSNQVNIETIGNEVLYRGVENVLVLKGKTADIKDIDADTEEIYQKDSASNLYYCQPSGNSREVNITVKKKTRKQTFTYRIFPVDIKLILRIDTMRSENIYSVENFRSFKGIMAVTTTPVNCSMDLKSMRITRINSSGQREVENVSNFPVRLISRAQSGDTYIFDQIKIAIIGDYDKPAEVRDAQDLVFFIE